MAGAQSPDMGATNQGGLEQEQEEEKEEEEEREKWEAQVEPEAEECLWRVHLQKHQSGREKLSHNIFYPESSDKTESLGKSWEFFSDSQL